MKKANVLNVRSIMKKEREVIRRFLRGAEEQHRMAQDSLREIRAYVKGREKPSGEDRALLREAEQLVRETREQLVYYRGALAGMSALESAILKHLIVLNGDPFGFPRR